MSSLGSCTLVLPNSQLLPQVIMEIESLRLSELCAMESINQMSFWADLQGLRLPFSHLLKWSLRTPSKDAMWPLDRPSDLLRDTRVSRVDSLEGAQKSAKGRIASPLIWVVPTFDLLCLSIDLVYRIGGSFANMPGYLCMDFSRLD